ncbi:hypothetical protein L7F22_006181 [Adiantum nelumboides]|nr:hypothetical protein [Adiantum nelumboides]
MLVVTTAGAGYVMGSGLAIDMYGLSWTCVGTLLVAAAANTINQVLLLPKYTRLLCMIAFSVCSCWQAATLFEWIESISEFGFFLDSSGGGLYADIRQVMRTPQCTSTTVMDGSGGGGGGVALFFRWAAAVGEVSMGGWVLASALYFWQIPHFMAIAYLCRQDYAAGGFKMLSMQDDSGQRTALAALRNCIYLFPVGYLAYRCGLTTEWFGVETALLSAVMGVMAASFYRNPSNEGAKKLFRASLLYLPIFLTAMLVHRLPNKDTNEVFNESYVTDVLDADHALEESMEKKPSQRKEFPQPPVASFSVAPFPFLPVPDFRSS